MLDFLMFILSLFGAIVLMFAVLFFIIFFGHFVIILAFDYNFNIFKMIKNHFDEKKKKKLQQQEYKLNEAKWLIRDYDKNKEAKC